MDETVRRRGDPADSLIAPLSALQPSHRAMLGGMMDNEIIGALGRTGHFVLESGHHGNLWLDLEALCLRPRDVEPFTTALSDRLRAYLVDAVCGPLNEGAFVALLVAIQLGVEFSYAERHVQPQREGLFPVEYRIPAGLRSRNAGKRIAIVNDVINAGSAVRGTYVDLLACDAVPVALASLLVLGEPAQRLAREWNVPLISLAHRPNRVWSLEDCPMCATGEPFDRTSGKRNPAAPTWQGTCSGVCPALLLQCPTRRQVPCRRHSPRYSFLSCVAH